MIRKINFWVYKIALVIPWLVLIGISIMLVKVWKANPKLYCKNQQVFEYNDKNKMFILNRDNLNLRCFQFESDLTAD